MNITKARAHAHKQYGVHMAGGIFPKGKKETVTVFENFGTEKLLEHIPFLSAPGFGGSFLTEV